MDRWSLLSDGVQEHCRHELASCETPEDQLSRACELLSVYVKRYRATANRLYQGNPEALSLMLLTIMELWTVLDASAVKVVPLLLEYQTGFPSGILDKLVLLKREDLDRLARVEDYLEQRRSGAVHRMNPWDLPRDEKVWPDTCFAARYYDSSFQHQRLHKRIMYHDRGWHWLHKAHVTPRSTTNRRLGLPEYHPPLPHGEVSKKVAVFEAKVPPAIAAWREITLSILMDNLADGEERQPVVSEALWYPAENHIIRRVVGQLKTQPRFRIMSWSIEHEGDKSTRYVGFYDLRLKKPLPTSMSLLHLSPIYSYAPETMNPVLKAYTLSTAHTLNDVIARQYKCPANMTLEEFRAFGNMRGGSLLQWHNILLQLSMPSLDLNRAETFYLLMQTANESGPRAGQGPLRHSHRILEEERFGNALLLGLEDALDRVTENGEPPFSLCMLVSVATKLLSISPSRVVQERCLACLRSIRHKAAGWVRGLVDKWREGGAGHSADEQQSLACCIRMMALVCHATFDVGSARFPSVLSDGRDAALLIEASLRAAEYTPPPHKANPTPILDILLRRWRRLSYEIEPWLRRKITSEESPCLDTALLKVWSSYTRETAWSSAQIPHEHVLTAHSAPKEGRDSLFMQYNLLTGAFTVDGSPLTMLPQDFQEHETFRRIFRDHIFTVTASTMVDQGMRYMATSTYHDHELHFGMFPNHELIVRSEKDERVYELIPVPYLGRDFPAPLLNGFTHWYVVGEDMVEFRPLDAAWQTLRDADPSSEGLILKFPRSDTDACLTEIHSHATAISSHSETSRLVCKVLRPLEDPTFIHIVLDQEHSALTIKLPRLGLTFHLASKEQVVRSAEYKGYVIDKNQFIGTLIGLENKLVLRRTSGITEHLDARLVIMPIGEVTYTRGEDGRSSSTRIVTGTDNRIRHRTFRLDTMLGCLRDDGALHSKMFLCYLHAMTAHFLPDTLTGRTGTEEALRVLHSAAARSAADRLDAADVGLLRVISRLSPIRELTEGRMHVSWPGRVPPAAQDDAFYQCVASILRRAELVELCFHPRDRRYREPLHMSSEALIRRAYARARAYGIPQYSPAQDIVDEPDTIYTGRADVEDPAPERGPRFDGELETYRLTRHLVDSKSPWGLLHPIPTPAPNPEHPFAKDGWSAAAKHIRREQKESTRNPIAESFLTGMSDSTATNWYWSLRLARKRKYTRARPYDLLFYLAQRMFSRDTIDLRLVQVLLADATTPRRARKATVPRVPAKLVASTVYRRASGNFPYTLCARLAECVLGERVYVPERAASIMEDYYCALYVAAVTSQVSKKIPIVPSDPQECPQGTVPPGKGRAREFINGGADDLFERPPPHLRCSPPWSFREYLEPNTHGEQVHLDPFLDNLGGMCEHKHEQDYVQELRDSLGAFRENLGQGDAPNESFVLARPRDAQMRRELLEYLERCRSDVADTFTAICQALDGTGAATCPEKGDPPPLPTGLPDITPILLLGQLSRKRRSKLSGQWLQCIADYAVSLTTLQRAKRLIWAVDDEKEFIKVILNIGHENWDPLKGLDRLLLEVESDILIRPVQADIVSSMVQPPGERNHIMQLNMGEGKSSVIVPVVAAEVADGSRLVRVIVAKPQTKQMVHTLTRALGGLLDRAVYQLPFSRDSQLSSEDATRMASLFKECVANGAVILAQPEHVLSFKLLGLEATITLGDKSNEAHSLLAAQYYLDKTSRDIIDESDENLSSRFELVYPMGPQQPIDLSPLRWRLIQSILGLAAEIAPSINQHHHDMLEVTPSSHNGGFPRIRILRESGAMALMDQLTQRIGNGELRGFPDILPRDQCARKAVVRYIRMLEPEERDVATVEAMLKANRVYEPVLLLRGLIAHSVLSFSLQKRWRVGYGRVYDRKPPTELAVPYHAKDAPSARSEFSHPDVTIILTCLSYYYRGLDDDELFRLAEHLSLSDDGKREYEAWIENVPNTVVPPALRRVDAITVRDREQCTRVVFPHLPYLKRTIDCYLSDIVFPKEMREFPQKLCESGWSIAETRPELTTGFSGTKDSKYLLPLGVEFLDLPKQRQTNAMVLNRLLDPNNAVQNMASPVALPLRPDPGHSHSRNEAAPSRAVEFLHQVANSEPEIRVILDAGAQIVELSNLEIAREWLALVPKKKARAAVFFDDEELRVVERDGSTEPFLTSPHATDIAACLVFLDQAHTRGTDLRLPDGYRAAVTLGPGLTKDQLVQACMRMRKLGQGQSVVCFVPAEIRRKIAALHGAEKGEMTVADVLSWSVNETWQEFRKLAPLWAAQGLRHQRQQYLWDRADTGKERYHLTPEAAKQFIEHTSRALREQYGSAVGKVHLALATAAASSDWTARDPKKAWLCRRIREKFQLFQNCGVGPSALDSEHERELQTEAEERRQMARLPPLTACQPSLHPDVEAFIKTGVLPADSTAIIPALDSLAGSSVGCLLDSLSLPPTRLYVTADFAHVVQPPTPGHMPDQCHRPVQWIATAPASAGQEPITAVILSPWEVNALLPTFGDQDTVTTLHLFGARTKLAMRPAEDLTLYTTRELPSRWVAPPTLVLLLILFAGQLYLRDYADYVDMCELLAVPHSQDEDDESREDQGQGSRDDSSGDARSNIQFFKALVWRIRRDCADISKTDIGRILSGDVLPPSTFSGTSIRGPYSKSRRDSRVKL